MPSVWDTLRGGHSHFEHDPAWRGSARGDGLLRGMELGRKPRHLRDICAHAAWHAALCELCLGRTKPPHQNLPPNQRQQVAAGNLCGGGGGKNCYMLIFTGCHILRQLGLRRFGETASLAKTPTSKTLPPRLSWASHSAARFCYRRCRHKSPGARQRTGVSKHGVCGNGFCLDCLLNKTQKGPPQKQHLQIFTHGVLPAAKQQAVDNPGWWTSCHVAPASPPVRIGK